MDTKKGAGGKPQEFNVENGRYGTRVIQFDSLPSATRMIQRYESRFGSIDNNVTRFSLNKAEWARYYGTIGDMQAGVLRQRKTKSGLRWVILNTDVLPNGTRTPPRILIDNGSYVHPRVTSKMTFSSDDEMYDFIDIIER